jgi:arylsulfatase A-like enzyme
MRAQKSIVLVTVDCLRADHAGFMGYARPTTPFLDELAKESFVFPNAIVAGAPTYYSLPAMMASRYPLALGRDGLGIAPDEATLASALKRAGYATAFFGAGNPYLTSRFGYGQGFDTYRDFLHDSLDEGPERLAKESASASDWKSRLNRDLEKISSKAAPLKVVYDELYFRYCQRRTPAAESLDALRRFPAADVIVDHACEWLASKGDGPFFLWLHLMDPHSPYYPTEEALTLMGRSSVSPGRARYLNSYWNRSDLGPRRLAGHRQEIVGLYDAGIRWVDVQMERLRQTLGVAGMWDDCIFALTADHGEEFLDHGGRYHPPSRLMEELIHVPLLVRVPGVEKREVEKSPFGMIHLAPTLLDAAQVAIPAEFQGRSYWPQVQAGATLGDVAISESVAGCMNPFRRENRTGPRLLAVREERFKLVLHFDQAKELLFDLESDPGEQAPLAPGAQRPVRRRLLELAREHLQRPVFQESRLRAALRELRLEWKTPTEKTSPVAL